MATVCLCTPKFTCYNLDPQIHILKGTFGCDLGLDVVFLEGFKQISTYC